MRNLLLAILLLPSVAMATDVTIPTTYTTNGSVTSTNLNGNFTALAQKINGGLDNENADTTNGYRFFETKSSLPSAGTQGRTIFLTTDNTLNLDTGSAYVKSVVTTSTPAQGDVIYYNGAAWADLPAGTSGYFLKTQGAGANPAWTAPTATDLSISSQTQGDILYRGASSWTRLSAGATAGLVLKTNTSIGTPQWVNSLGEVLDYGTSDSSSTSRQGTALKVAYGHDISVGGAGSQAVTNLSFTSNSSYTVVCSANSSFGTPPAGTDQSAGNIVCTPGSGSSFTIYNTDDQTKTVAWIAMGT